MTVSGRPSDQKLVTIGISTFNRVDTTFPAALRSALAQTYDNVEVVVCDNASEDGTQAFMTAIADPRLRYVRHAANIGANNNFNACLAAARGSYFLLLHDDDLLERDFVERAMQSALTREPGVMLGGVRKIRGDGSTINVVSAPQSNMSPAGLFSSWFARQCSFYFCSTLFHTQRLRDAGGFSSPEGLFQDVVAIARIVSAAGYASVPGVAGSFRRHDENRGGTSHALRWLRDSVYLLDTITTSFPLESASLRASGARYLSQKCYRYVAHEPSPSERRKLYREIYHQLDHAYAPWRYAVRAMVKHAHRRLTTELQRRHIGRRGNHIGAAHHDGG